MCARCYSSVVHLIERLQRRRLERKLEHGVRELTLALGRIETAEMRELAAAARHAGLLG